MKVTKSQLKQIIKEELNEMKVINNEVRRQTILNESLREFGELSNLLKAVTSQGGARTDVLAAFALAFEELLAGLDKTAEAYGLASGGGDPDSKAYVAKRAATKMTLSQLQMVAGAPSNQGEQ